jgi:hypothetical protein
VRRLHQTSDIYKGVTRYTSPPSRYHSPDTNSSCARLVPQSNQAPILHYASLRPHSSLPCRRHTHIAAGSPPTPQAEAWDLPNINTILNTISNRCLPPHRIATFDASDGECSYATNRKLHPRPPLFRNFCADDNEFAIRPRMSLNRSCLLPSLTPYIAAIPQTTPAKYVHAISTSQSLQNQRLIRANLDRHCQCARLQANLARFLSLDISKHTCLSLSIFRRISTLSCFYWRESSNTLTLCGMFDRSYGPVNTVSTVRNCLLITSRFYDQAWSNQPVRLWMFDYIMDSSCNKNHT